MNSTDGYIEYRELRIEYRQKVNTLRNSTALQIFQTLKAEHRHKISSKHHQGQFFNPIYATVPICGGRRADKVFMGVDNVARYK